MILRRDADPGSLLRAQDADMMGKGLVIAALMRRAYGEDWPNYMPRFPLTVPARSFVRLWEFGRDFEIQERQTGASKRIFESGYWLAPSRSDYSVAVTPVLWPPTEMPGQMPVLPREQCSDGRSGQFSATGSGDMAFGAFFLLAGL